MIEEEKMKEDQVSLDLPKPGDDTPEANDTTLENSKKLFTHKEKGYRVGFLSAKKIKSDEGVNDWESEDVAKDRLSSLFEMDIDHQWDKDRKGFISSPVESGNIQDKLKTDEPELSPVEDKVETMENASVMDENSTQPEVPAESESDEDEDEPGKPKKRPQDS